MGARDPTDLDERILRAEDALIEREHRIKTRIAGLRRRVESATQPRRWMAPAGGAAVALLALLWLWRHGKPKSAAAPQRSGGASATAGAAKSLPLLGLIPTLWPLLPKRWTSGVSPATVTSVATVALPLIERLISGAPKPPLPTMPVVDIARFAGTWHEIARLPEPFEAFCDGQPSATYTPAPDGNLRVTNVCPKRGGGMRKAHGTARIVPGTGDAKLKVTFLPAWLQWLPFGWADYWILEVDDTYSTALVGNPGRNFMWVLARRRRIDSASLQSLLALARRLGFDITKVKVTQPN